MQSGFSKYSHEETTNESRSHQDESDHENMITK